MNKEADWNLYRTFLAVADAGSHSAAGRKLKLSHATVGRHIAELENHLGQKLFVRETDGYALTPAGDQLKSEADTMASAAMRAERVANVSGESPKGVVRISTAATLTEYWLVPHLAQFQKDYPDVELEFVTDSWPASVRRREADMVVRLYSPGQENLVGKKIARCGVAFYASKDYVAKHGVPEAREEWEKHSIIGFCGASAEHELARWATHVTRNAPTQLRCSSMTDQLSAVREGVGISALTCVMGDSYEDLVRIAPEKLFSATEMWLLAHPDLRQTEPVSTVFEFIADKAKENREQLLGRVSA